jgi:hypothetical protein
MFALSLLNAQARRRAPGRLSSQDSQLRTPAVEGLERRVLLAGNVVTTPTGTPTSPGEPAPGLLIEGDPADNEIMVKKGTAPGEIIVNGLDGTLVNGSTQEWHFNGVESLFVTMDGGNDSVDLRNLTLSGVPDENGFAAVQVVVDGGAGDDSITMFNTTINASAPPPDPDVLLPQFVGGRAVVWRNLCRRRPERDRERLHRSVQHNDHRRRRRNVRQQYADLRRAEQRRDDHRRQRPH